MRPGPPDGKLALMTDDLIALRLELVPGAEPIRGNVASESGEPREFEGWLGLADALAKVLGRRP